MTCVTCAAAASREISLMSGKGLNLVCSDLDRDAILTVLCVVYIVRAYKAGSLDTFTDRKTCGL